MKERNQKPVVGAYATRNALEGKPLLCLLLGMALAGVFSPLAALGESEPRRCVAVSSAGLIDSRNGHTVATAEAIINTAHEIGSLLIFR